MTNPKTLLLVPPSKFSKNVARDLVYGCWCKGKRIAGVTFPPVSLAMIATVLRKNGLDADVLDAAGEGLGLDEVLKETSQYDFCIMLTSSMTLNEDAEILDTVKRNNPRIITVVFGGHVTAEPKSTLSRKGIDIVVRREAEFIIKDIVSSFRSGDDWRKIMGISHMDDGKYYENPPYPLIENLDDLSVPDRQLLSEKIDYFNPLVKRMPYTTMFTSRGCPGACTFCSSPTFYGRSIRFMSANRVLEEMKECAKLGYREIFFRDEIFTASKSRVIEICEGIKKAKLDISWICSSRINTIDKEMMVKMKEAGCHMIRFGVESGCQELLNNVKKGIKVEKIKEVFRWAREVRLDTHAHMMIGIPGESHETLKRTLRFLKEIKPTTVTFGILTPYAGTELFDKLKEYHPEMGDGTTMDVSKLHTHAYYNEYFTKLTATELQKYIRKVYRNFYLNPRYIIRRLVSIRNKDEFKRTVLAGLDVFNFVFGKDD
ncbi:radical SAM protein [Candidatus Parcubacteria bacterium]|nr:MAG: radical SAM protein [Candidatus Parcubacteria bacterium]